VLSGFTNVEQIPFNFLSRLVGLAILLCACFFFLLRVIFVKAVAIIDAYSSQYWIAWPFHSFVKETVPLLLS